MQKITVYDVEAETLEKLEEVHDCTSADIIQALLEAVEDGTINLDDYI